LARLRQVRRKCRRNPGGKGDSRIITNFIYFGLLDRKLKLKVVSVESGVGWIPFLLVALDYQATENNVDNTDFPHPTSLYPQPLNGIAKTFADTNTPYENPQEAPRRQRRQGPQHRTAAPSLIDSVEPGHATATTSPWRTVGRSSLWHAARQLTYRVGVAWRSLRWANNPRW
jgi:hypothetical protein